MTSEEALYNERYRPSFRTTAFVFGLILVDLVMDKFGCGLYARFFASAARECAWFDPEQRIMAIAAMAALIIGLMALGTDLRTTRILVTRGSLTVTRGRREWSYALSEIVGAEAVMVKTWKEKACIADPDGKPGESGNLLIRPPEIWREAVSVKDVRFKSAVPAVAVRFKGYGRNPVLLVSRNPAKLIETLRGALSPAPASAYAPGTDRQA